MILYNVTTSLDPEIEEQWVSFMRDTHIPEVMATGFFIKSQLCRLLNEEDNGVTYAAQYYCVSLNQLEEYQEVAAPALREAVEKHFSGRYASFRTMLEIVE
ncbi:DUF4286 family protein [Hymenobacter swuensis]|uniref:DUF4286 domain-containing protein n=1 Tax=Hymenobacter swuensis DY53 TaxID=1227739 RepID=W8F1Y8_9BACT|nr:DUF4286 family protein [Hymenobacter swuensis]AHJ95845.1 hypothetical protein Hsw_0250 [Hymenobacter swuensis DY53]